MRAHFIYRPRTAEDLRLPHLTEEEHEFEIVHTIVLPSIDYENFSSDLLADRNFISENYWRCSEGDIYRCLLIKSRGNSDGILVLPQNTDFVKLAAYYS